jgi:hypothetical protein
MTLFDAPTREICRVRRSRTNTPLQALVLLNDETYVEAARVLAQKMLTEGGKTPGERITYAFRRVLCRRPTAHELGILTAGTSMRLVNYHADIGAAKRLDAVGDTAMPTGIDPAELGAYTLTASIILNMDEAITRT